MNILIVVHCIKIGVNLGVFNIAIYVKTVRCSFSDVPGIIYKCVFYIHVA